MSTHDSRALVLRWIEAWVSSDTQVLADLFSPDYTVNGDPVGIDGVKQAVIAFHAGLSDLEVEVNELVAEAGKVALRWSLRGRHTGNLFGMPPTGRVITLRGINIYQIANGRISANHEETNAAQAFQPPKNP